MNEAIRRLSENLYGGVYPNDTLTARSIFTDKLAERYATDPEYQNKLVDALLGAAASVSTEESKPPKPKSLGDALIEAISEETKNEDLREESGSLNPVVLWARTADVLGWNFSLLTEVEPGLSVIAVQAPGPAEKTLINLFNRELIIQLSEDENFQEIDISPLVITTHINEDGWLYHKKEQEG